jgi:hypothetical protein
MKLDCVVQLREDVGSLYQEPWLTLVMLLKQRIYFVHLLDSINFLWHELMELLATHCSSLNINSFIENSI